MLSGGWGEDTNGDSCVCVYMFVCTSVLSISLSCVHSQLWLVLIPSIPLITLTIISTPAASLLQLAVISTTRAAHGPLAPQCPFQTGPIPQVRVERGGWVESVLERWPTTQDWLALMRRIGDFFSVPFTCVTVLSLTLASFCKIHPFFSYYKHLVTWLAKQWTHWFCLFVFFCEKRSNCHHVTMSLVLSACILI